MERESIIRAIREAAVDNRLTCEKAHGIAAELHVAPAEIGRLCDELKIRISSCQLGCF